MTSTWRMKMNFRGQCNARACGFNTWYAQKPSSRTSQSTPVGPKVARSVILTSGRSRHENHREFAQGHLEQETSSGTANSAKWIPHAYFARTASETLITKAMTFTSTTS
mmetsp:Transcript_11776/g.21003  ORF Transcript_11776/g.21003 Transcript_11776/m.21003 type:complete len:109 (-) Transcript_11776:70-396(-)